MRRAFNHTWSIVRGEVYHGYRWMGRIEGRLHWGGGLGTNVLAKTDGRWAVTHEHLTPYDEARAARCAPEGAARKDTAK